MKARTGVARLALTTGAPVIPIAHWGAQDVLPYGSSRLTCGRARRCEWWPVRRWTCRHSATSR